MPKKKIDISNGEWSIMRTIWTMQPCTVPDVQEALYKEKKWAYATVKTMMDRMVNKSLLSVEKIRNLSIYRAKIQKEQAMISEVRKTLHRVFDGSLTPMMQFMLENEDLSEGELNEMMRHIRARMKAEKSRKS